MTNTRNDGVAGMRGKDDAPHRVNVSFEDHRGSDQSDAVLAERLSWIYTLGLLEVLE